MPTIVCIGDSLTEGHSGGYPKTLEDLLRQREPNSHWDVRNYGKRGFGTKDWLACVTPIAAGADVIVLMIGTNDAQTCTGVFSEEQYIGRLTQLIKRFMSEAPSAAFHLVIPPPAVLGGSFTQYFDANIINSVFPRVIPQVAASLGLACIDCFTPFGGATPNGQAFSDGIHVTQDGSKVLATTVFGAVSGSVSNKGKSVAPSIPNPNQQLQIPIANTGITSASPLALSPNNRMQSPLTVTATPSYSPTRNANAFSMQSVDTYATGSAVEVYSKSKAAWFPGKVTAFDGQNVTIDFKSFGKTLSKTMPAGHPEMRLQAATTQGAAVKTPASTSGLASPATFGNLTACTSFSQQLPCLPSQSLGRLCPRENGTTQ
jgi:lysophospholipase L1-like esterase